MADEGNEARLQELEEGMGEEEGADIDGGGEEGAEGAGRGEEEEAMEEYDSDDSDSLVFYEHQEVIFESEAEENSDEEESAGGDRVQYDATLPSRHMYLGETQELRGRTVQDENDVVTIPLLLHNALMNLVLIPTQTLPMTIFHPLHVSMLRQVIAKDRTFGIIHTKLNPDGNSEVARYGTTAEIYEYQEEELTGALSIKAKGRQRFRVISTRRETTGLYVARVQILPEIRMESPFAMMRLHSLDKFTLPRPPDHASPAATTRPLASLRTANMWRVMGRNAWLTPWPPWVYHQYDDQLLAQRVVNQIQNTTMIHSSMVQLPRDPQELSHWAAINLPLDDSHRLTLLALNTPTQRLRYILSVLAKCEMLLCIQCNEVVGDTGDIFSMSVEGPQGTFVNPGGFVHEMITLTKATNLSYSGAPSTQHSWFPGYAWTVASCSGCFSHMGWKFTAAKDNMKPKKFFGITRKAVRTKLEGEGEDGEMKIVM